MGRYSVKRYKTKRYTRSLDQVLNDDMGSETRILELSNQPYDETKPGLGQHYCVPCARYFETEIALKSHLRGKVHKRVLKSIKEGPYTIEEADAAAGHDVEKYSKKQTKQTTIITESPMAKALLEKPAAPQSPSPPPPEDLVGTEPEAMVIAD